VPDPSLLATIESNVPLEESNSAQPQDISTVTEQGTAPATQSSGGSAQQRAAEEAAAAAAAKLECDLLGCIRDPADLLSRPTAHPELQKRLRSSVGGLLLEGVRSLSGQLLSSMGSIRAGSEGNATARSILTSTPVFHVAME
jgi:hypothetical protein